MSIDNIRRDDWILGGLAILLVIALVALPWISFGGGSVSSPVGSFSVPSIDLTALDGPAGWTGVVALIACLAFIADLAVERLSPQTQLPSIGGSREMTRFALAAAAGGFIALKFLLHVSFTLNNFGFGFFVVVVVAAALLYFAMQARASAPAPAVAPPTPSPAGPAGSAGPPVS